MAQPQLKTNYLPKAQPVNRKKIGRNLRVKTHSSQRLDSSTLAAEIQFEEDQRDHFYSLIALIVKSGILLIAITSSLKLGLASHQTINRNIEIVNVLKSESEKLERLQYRFDTLFSIGGEDKLMEEQDQWIAPNSKRIIWR